MQHDPSKTFQELIEENALLKQRIQVLEKSELERKQAQDALRESEALFHSLIDYMHDAMLILNWDGAILFANRAAAKIMDIEQPEEFVGHNMVEYLHPDSFQKAAEDLEAVKADKMGFLSEYQLYSVTGRHIWVESIGGKIVYRNAPANLVCIRDITKRRRAEEALQESERHMKLALEGTDQGLWEWDILSRKVVYDENWQRIMNLSAEGRYVDMDQWLASMDAEGRAAFEINLTDYLANRERYYELELRLQTENKEWKWIWTRGIATERDPSGIPLRMIGTYRDITKRKQAEEVLREREQKYRTLIETTDTGFVIIDQDGFVLDANPEYVRLTGNHELSDIVGRSIIEWTADYEREKNKLAVGECLQKGYIRNLEIDYVDAKGNVTPIELNATCMETEGMLQIITLCRDITERRQVEENYRSIFENAQEGIFQSTIEGKFLTANRSLADMLGYDSPEELMTTVIDIPKQLYVNPADRKLLLKMIEEKGPARGFETHFYRKNGSTIWVSVNQHAVRDAGGHVLYYEGFSEDITNRKQAEEALRESEEKHKSLLRNIPDIIFTIDLEGKITFVSQRTKEILGYENDEAITMNILNFIPEEDHQRAMENLHEGIKGKKIKLFQIPMIAKSGERLFFECSFSRVYKGGALVGVQGTAVDITERKLAEEELRKSEKYFRAITENAADVLFIVDAQGTITYCSPSVERILGYRPEELIGTSGFDLIIPEDQPRAFEDFGKASLTTDIEVPNSSRVRHKNGTVLTMEGIGKNLYHDPVIAGFVMNIRDVTERKRAEEALRETQRRLSDIIEFLPDATLVIDRDEKVIAWNRAMETMTGVKMEDMLGKGNHEYAIPFYGDRRPLLIDLALHPDKEMEKQYTAIHRAGDIFFGESFTPNLPPGDIHLSATASVLRDSKGEIIAAIECFRDNTERKRLEGRLNRAEKMEGLGRLAGGVAHDLNNVMGVLVGYSELLTEKLPEGSSLKKYAENIQQSGMRGAAIIQDLLTLARRGVAVSEVVDLNKVIFDYLRMPEFENLRCHHPQVKIRTELEERLLNIKGSPVHLSKTFTNLVSNAAEAISGEGEVKIRTENRYLDQPIRGYDDMQDGDYVVLTVSDSGRGISAQDIGKIFEPFYTKKVMGRSGTGLGLAVVWGTVKDHNGYIDVQSEEGKGATFTLYFPVTRDDLTKTKEAVSPSIYVGKGESILVVDDVKEQRELAMSMLGRLGYRVEAMASGEEAIDYLKNKKVDLVVLDMIMDPGIDGLETYGRMLEINPEQKAIIVSGFSETGRVRKAQEIGAGAFVRKPYILEKIGLAVREELDRK